MKKKKILLIFDWKIKEIKNNAYDETFFTTKHDFKKFYREIVWIGNPKVSSILIKELEKFLILKNYKKGFFSFDVSSIDTRLLKAKKCWFSWNSLN